MDLLSQLTVFLVQFLFEEKKGVGAQNKAVLNNSTYILLLGDFILAFSNDNVIVSVVLLRLKSLKRNSVCSTLDSSHLLVTFLTTAYTL